jgi:hypothetical protein
MYSQKQTHHTHTTTQADIVGFRSPDLSLNDDLFEVMTENKFLYDSSSTVILSGTV